MREIKLRAWDSIEGVMIYSGDEAADFEVIDGIVKVRYCTTQWKEGGGEVFEDDTWLEVNVEIMQYTGLKDKNGKEIYEGDIIKWKDEGNEQVMHSTQWDGSINEHTAPFMSAYGTTCGRNFRTFMNIYDPTRFGEIIGNIYENPELIK